MNIVPASETQTSTHCPYCALQCGMILSGQQASPVVAGNERFPVNKGGLCVKGWTGGETLAHADRLLTPLVRNGRGRLVRATWNEALDLVASRIREIQARHGANAVGVFGMA
jgi:assimilatory nitrate reductase catalytic subunit